MPSARIKHAKIIKLLENEASKISELYLECKHKIRNIDILSGRQLKLDWSRKMVPVYFQEKLRPISQCNWSEGWADFITHFWILGDTNQLKWNILISFKNTRGAWLLFSRSKIIDLQNTGIIIPNASSRLLTTDTLLSLSTVMPQVFNPLKSYDLKYMGQYFCPTL